MYHYVFRGLLGLIIGLLAGAAIGACLLILLIGPGEYFKSINDNRPAGIISGSGTESGFTLAITFIFALYGAIGGALLGTFVGLFSAARVTSPRIGGEIGDETSGAAPDQVRNNSGGESDNGS